MRTTQLPSPQNVSIAVIGKEQKMKLHEDEDVQQFVSNCKCEGGLILCVLHLASELRVVDGVCVCECAYVHVSACVLLILTHLLAGCFGLCKGRESGSWRG